jgi:integrase/recombinase XerD
MKGVSPRTKLPATSQPLGNSNLIEMFLQDCHIRGLTKRTIDNYASNIKTFFDRVKRSAQEVELSELRKFLTWLRDERHLADSTISMYYSTLHSFYEYLEFEGYIESNIIPKFRRRYLAFLRRNNRSSSGNRERQLISIDEMRKLINSIINPRDKAVVTLLAKTGIRRQELVNTDIDDIDWIEQSITLKPTPKRTNRLVFFDDECARILRRWLQNRNNWHINEKMNALFVNEQGMRLNRNGIYNIVTKHAQRLGLHVPHSKDLRKKFTPHCCRHWFTTHLRRAGMPREHIKELRGDSRAETMDIYYHIDRKELRDSYLAHIPQLAI